MTETVSGSVNPVGDKQPVVGGVSDGGNSETPLLLVQTETATFDVWRFGKEHISPPGQVVKRALIEALVANA